MIEAGEKKEEYRELKAYWLNRIKTADQFTHVSFTHGYARDARRMVFEIKNISCREGRPEWGADPGRLCFVIELGERLDPPDPSENYFTEDPPEFVECSECDGHPACEDFGCAIHNGLGHLVARDPGSM